MQRIRLSNTEFEGKNNAYLLGLDGDGPITLVDTAIDVEETRNDLRAGLATYGIEFADIEQVLLTHWHSDHAGLAGTIQRAGGATVYVHGADAGLVDGSDRGHFFTERRRRFVQWGIPADERRALLSFLDRHESRRGTPPQVTTFEAGQRFQAGGRELIARHVPGHSAGLTAYVFEDGAGRGAFVGDAILPKYTPNVGGADPRVRAPVETYVDSLRTLRALECDRCLPGHRDPIEDPAERAATIIEHHRTRTRRVFEAVDRLDQATAWEVSAALFGHLEGIHVMHGPGEAFAHLDHLVRAGAVQRCETRYRLDPGFDGAVDTVLPGPSP